MASNRAPKHDFAPAWLKIPENEGHKSSGAKQAEQHPDRPGWGRPRDDFYGDRRGYPLPKNRHHSLDDEYYNNYYGYYGSGGYSGWCGNGNFRSQPTLNRDGGGKYPHGGPRYPPGPMNGFRPPPPPPPHPMNKAGYYDCYGGYGGATGNFDLYYPPQGNRPQSALGGPRRLYDSRASRTTDKENKQHNNNTENSSNNSGGKKKKEPNLEEEFPSLIGDNEPAPETKTAKTLNNSGVWDNPRDSVKHNTSNIYKALIPNKANLVKKGNKDHKDVNSNTSSPFSKPGKEPRIMSPTVEALNTRTITQPKKLPDKKSDFLKQLKMDKQVTNGDLKEDRKEEQSEEHLVNGVSDLRVDQTGAHIFSSSEEQRLLKEMGWTEDEEEYVITEDEKKQMLKNIQMLKQQRNGFNRRGKLWSPQHYGVPIFHSPPLNDSLSTSSDDSDIDDICK